MSIHTLGSSDNQHVLIQLASLNDRELINVVYNSHGYAYGEFPSAFEINKIYNGTSTFISSIIIKFNHMEFIIDNNGISIKKAYRIIF